MIKSHTKSVQVYVIIHTLLPFIFRAQCNAFPMQTSFFLLPVITRVRAVKKHMRSLRALFIPVFKNLEGFVIEKFAFIILLHNPSVSHKAKSV